MNIEGLDYNTQREHLLLPEYGREIQRMVDHACSLPSKAERQRCAETIVKVMERMVPQNRENPNYKQKLWDHLALMSDFKLDIDWPYDISEANHITARPESMNYPMHRIPVKHYGALVFEAFEKLKTMEPGKARDELARHTANQMKRDLLLWSHGTHNDEKVADDMARYTDGRVQLDLSKFKFERINERELLQAKQPTGKKKRRG